MESTKKRSESPLAKNKVKVQESDSSENKDEATEQTKPKKRISRNKQKSHAHNKEKLDSGENDNRMINENDNRAKDESGNSSQIESGENCKENGDSKPEVKDGLVNDSCMLSKELLESSEAIETSRDDKAAENSLPQSNVSNEVNTNSTASYDADEKESNKENCIEQAAIDKEPYEDANLSLENSILNDSQMSQNENSMNKSLAYASILSIPSVNGHDLTETSEIHMNGSEEDSIYEETKESESQVSPDTATNEESYGSSKVSHFSNNWSIHSPLLKDGNQSLEILGSKKGTDLLGDFKPVMHPYLSKVTGRPGIKGRSNLSSLNTNGSDVQTPKNKVDPLNDSFRVKSDPPRFKPVEPIEENVLLKKYRGKRNLNDNDEFEDGGGDEEIFATASKRRKLQEKDSKSGFLRGMLWSPFKKKSLESENILNLPTETQSKLSRFLSPFWFWKKTVTDCERN